MITWWNALTGLEQVFAAIAIPATILLLLQTVLLLFGIGDSSYDGDVSADGGHDAVDDPGMRIFTIRGFVAFFTIFGWSGIVFLKAGLSIPLSIIIALVLGFISMLLIALAIVGFMKLQADGTVTLETVVGATGTVYLAIPPARKGTGKVTVLVGERWNVYDACTDFEKKLFPEQAVTVVGITGENKLVVLPA